MTFKDGGAFDFHSNFERVKETLSQAVEVARESGRAGQAPNIDLSTVNLEQLPAYEELGGGLSSPPPRTDPPAPFAPTAVRPPQSREAVLNSFSPPNENTPPARPAAQQQFQPPSGPPPGYEEAQQSSVVNNLEESIRRSQ